MTPTLRLVIHPSPGLAACLSALHLAAGLLGGSLLSPVWLKAAIVTAVVWSFRQCLGEVALLRAPGAIVAVTISRDGKVLCRSRSGAWLEYELLPSSFVSHRLTILNLRVRGSRHARHVVLCGDNTDADDLRRLRVWLRWAAGKSVRSASQ